VHFASDANPSPISLFSLDQQQLFSHYWQTTRDKRSDISIGYICTSLASVGARPLMKELERFKGINGGAHGSWKLIRLFMHERRLEATAN
jgi:hypothetical protein